MANLSLANLLADVDKTFGNWAITWGTEDEPRETQFKYWVRADKETRKEFLDLFTLGNRALSGGLTEEEVAPIASGEVDAYDYITAQVQEVFAKLAVDAEDFKELAESIGNDFTMWQMVLDTYYKHYQAGEASPSQTS